MHLARAHNPLQLLDDVFISVNGDLGHVWLVMTSERETLMTMMIMTTMAGWLTNSTCHKRQVIFEMEILVVFHVGSNWHRCSHQDS